MILTIISFGYLHGQPPTADITVDLRTFRDPHVNPTMRQLTGRDQAVITKVLATPRIGDIVDGIVAELLTSAKYGESETIAVGCAGGRHRSVVVADTAAAMLRQRGHAVTVDHRDIDRPVVTR